MKISQMGTAEAAKCLCRIAEPVGRIGADEKITGYLKALSSQKGKAMLTVVTDALAALLPALLDTHYADVVEVLSALTGKGKDEIDAQTLIITMRDARECIDQDLIDFFMPSSATDGEK